MSEIDRLITLQMPPELVELLDATAKKHGTSRSELIRRACWDYTHDPEPSGKTAKKRPAERRPPTKQTFIFQLSPKELTRLDHYAITQGRSRSVAVATALDNHMHASSFKVRETSTEHGPRGRLRVGVQLADEQAAALEKLARQLKVGKSAVIREALTRELNKAGVRKR